MPFENLKVYAMQSLSHVIDHSHEGLSLAHVAFTPEIKCDDYRIFSIVQL